MPKKSLSKKIDESADKSIKRKGKELNAYAALEALAQSEGGRIIIQALKTDILAVLDTLAIKYQTLPHAELIAACADMAAKLDTLRTLTNATKNKKFVYDELVEFLGEDAEEED